MAEKRGIELRLVGVLVLIMLFSGLFLTVVYEVTIPYIREHQAQARERAVFEVLPKAVEFEPLTVNDLVIFRGMNEEGRTVGYALEETGAGFQDMIILMVGLDLETGRVTGLSVLRMSETPGLGARITEADFRSQFVGKELSGSFKAGKDFDAITGATLSSQTVGHIIENAAAKVLALDLEGGDKK